MKNYFSLRKFFYLGLACTIFTACVKKDAFDFSHSSMERGETWGTALVNDEVFFTDFAIAPAISVETDNEVIKIVYSVPLVSSGKVEDIFSAKDYLWDFALTDIEEPSSPPSADRVIFSGGQDILFYGDTDQIWADSAVFHAGKFQLVLNSPFHHAVKFRIKSVYFHYPDGSILDTLLTLNPGSQPLTIDLKGCRTRLKRNALPCEITILAYDDGLPFAGGKQTMQVDVSGKYYVFKFLRGKVATLTERIHYETDFNLGDDKKMSFWVKNIKGGKIRLNSFNSFGAGMTFTVDTSEIVAHGVITNLLSSAHSAFQFDPAPVSYMPKRQTFTIDLGDFSIAEKNVFRFGGSVLVNAPGLTGADIWGFDTSSFSIEPSLEIPLDFNLNHFFYRDTIPQDFSGLENAGILKDLTFRIELANDFPLELKVQLYFLDRNHKAIDSLFSQPTIVEAARTSSADGKTISAGKTQPTPLFVAVDESRLNKISGTRYICIDARATSNNRQALVRADQKLKIKIGVKTTMTRKSDR